MSDLFGSILIINDLVAVQSLKTGSIKTDSKRSAYESTMEDWCF
jgi:hypothetical protein